MRSTNQAEIQKAFTQQAGGFESECMNFSKKDYLDYVVAKLKPTKRDEVLEVAAGTCACGRALAVYANHVTCLDMTPAMLAVGKKKAEKAGLDHLTFVLGDAAELPFLDNSFSIVLSRLAFHHFPEVERPFAEMTRVLGPEGKLVLIDMEAADESLREMEDAIETMRDPSHIRNLSQKEMLALYEKQGLNIECCETVRMPMKLKNWMAHTETPPDVRDAIRAKMEAELDGREKTGLAPYRLGSDIWFDQRWVLIIGRKK